MNSKRLFDLVVAGVILAATAPICVVAAAAIKLTSRGPVLYRAPRAGLGGNEFAMLKFRTMRTGSDHVDRMVTARNDDRITRVGGWLRQTKVDELPQLINVLRGDMSIVGPRPEDITIVRDHYTPEQWRTLEVLPGIASLAEIRWYPDLTHHDPAPDDASTQQWYIERHMPAELTESLRYVDTRSLAMDIRIVATLAWLTIRYAFSDPPVVSFDPDEYTRRDHRPHLPLE